MDQYLDGMVDFADWLASKGIMSPELAATAMACFCMDKFGGTPYDDYVTRYLDR